LLGAASHPILLAQAGRDSLTNYTFILEAPWKACRLCGTVYQSDDDRLAYLYAHGGEGTVGGKHYRIMQPDESAAAHHNAQGKQRRELWLEIHNKLAHPNFFTELRQLELSGLPYTPEAAQKLSTYGIIYMGEIPHEDEVAQALLEAPRAPVNDAEG
jgi:hypothetical protein